MTIKETLLQPTIESIEANLFTPSSELMERWFKGEVSEGEDKLLTEHPIAQRHRKTYDTFSNDNIQTSSIDKEIKMPVYLKKILNRHLQAKNHFQSVTDFRPGQVRLIESLPNKDHIKSDQKLAVLLFESIDSSEDKVWRGFMTAPETAWAGYWDMLLEADIDEPFDPLVGMIQVWNSVNIDEKYLGNVVAELSLNRVQAVRALKEEYLLGEDLDPKQAYPGKVFGRETFHGFNVLTGSPLTEDDARHRYQMLYHTVAKVVSVPLTVEIEEVATSSVFERMIESMQILAEHVGNSLILQPNVANAMGDSSPDLETKTFHYNDCLELKVSLFKDDVDELINIQGKTTKDVKCSLHLMSDDGFSEETEIKSEFCQPITIDPEDSISLLIKCEGFDTIELKLPF